MPSFQMDAWCADTWKYWEDRGFAPRQQNILLAVSGGLDSACLLDFFAAYGAGYYSAKLGVAHVHHGLREDAEKDLLWVKGKCEQLNLPFHAKRLDPKDRPQKESVEMWGRRERYAFFDALQKSENYDWVATAHHLSDQVETVFMRLERGTGLRGLQGIHFCRGPLVRPFLNRTREELFSYAEFRGLDWREDGSNLNVEHERNWFRRVYLPREYLADPLLAQRIQSITEQTQEIWEKMQREITRHLQVEGVQTYLRLDKFSSIYDESKEMGFLYLDVLAKESGLRLSEAEFKEFQRQWEQKGKRPAICLSSDWTLCLNSDRLWIEKNREESIYAEKPCYSFIWNAKLEVQRFEWVWFERRCTLVMRSYSRPQGFNLKRQKGYKAYFDAESTNDNFTIRTRQAGDRFKPLGMAGCSKKLKDYFNDLKLPVKKRDKQIIVSNGGRIAWLPPLEISEELKIKPETKRIIELEIKWQS